MKVDYSEQHSQIIEQFFIPHFLYDDMEKEWNFSHQEKEMLKDVLPVMEDLRELFLPFREKIERYYLMGYDLSLLHAIFIDMVYEEKEVTSAEDVHAYCLSLSAEEIQEQLRQLLNTEREHMAEETDFWERLDLSTAKPETKWHFSHFYRNPIASMQELVKLSRELVELYQPYLEQGAAERHSYAQSFSLENMIQKNPVLSHFSWDFSDQAEVKLYIISPWLVRFMSYGSGINEKTFHYFIVSCRVDRLFGVKQTLDTEHLTHILKVISDETRYKVLVELTKPYAKSKDIADALDITGAAVSFHTQKLINAQLLLLNREDKNIKYDVNKDLLRETIAKLKEDFHLEK